MRIVVCTLVNARFWGCSKVQSRSRSTYNIVKDFAFILFQDNATVNVLAEVGFV